MTSKIKLVVGLGNPGATYEGTRHNIGRRIVQALSKSSGVHWLMPDAFMNQSGIEVAKKAAYFRIPPQDILIILDEFQIPLGQLKTLKSGSDGGHNGMKSVIEALNTQEVPRMRIGIGPLMEGADSAKFVLERFSKAEEAKLQQLLPHMETAVMTAVTQGIDVAMNQFNGKVLA